MTTPQSKLQSAKETIISIGIGFGLSLILQSVLAHVYGFNASVSDNIQVTIWFTVLSLVRSYCVRRYFAKRDLQNAQNISV